MLRSIAYLALAGVMVPSSTTLPTSLAAPELAATTAAPAACNDGKNRRVRMQNDTRFTIVRLYGSRQSTDDWEEDVLGDGVLAPGRSVVVNWDDGTCACIYDFKAIYSDDDTSTKFGVNVCSISTFRFYE